MRKLKWFMSVSRAAGIYGSAALIVWDSSDLYVVLSKNFRTGQFHTHMSRVRVLQLPVQGKQL